MPPRRFPNQNYANHKPPCLDYLIGPVTVGKYEAKGKFDFIKGEGGMKCYITGPPTATKGIIFIYDLFGYYPGTLQGADILASTSNGEYKVFIPDLFNGRFLDKKWADVLPEKFRTLEVQVAIKNFMIQAASEEAAAAKIPAFVEALKKEFPTITEFGGLGASWGASILAANSQCKDEATNLFTSALQLYPIPSEITWDFSELTIPVGVLTSRDEEHVSFKDINWDGGFAERFDTMEHGWMTARADLWHKEKRWGYVRGWGLVLGFFADNLSDQPFDESFVTFRLGRTREGPPRMPVY